MKPKSPSLAPWIALALALVLGQAAAERPKLERGAPLSDLPELDLGGHRHGKDAVDALGVSLPDVAKAYKLTGDQLRLKFLTDSTLRADRHGRLHYVEPGLGAEGIATATRPVPSGSVAKGYALSQTFFLHSRPGASRVLFLDFDGDVMSGNAWTAGYNGGANIVAPAWSIDSDPTTFSTNELQVIQEIWQRVAEDYAPFDVDITTEDPGPDAITRSGTSDTVYGSKVLISPISSFFGSYGGIAYVGIYNMTSDYYKPALVFPENLAPTSSSHAKYVAEAASHEAGHNLGLSHDGTSTTGYYQGQGTGTTGWAPIMGVGYYKNVSQWSLGEYADANNFEDDISVIISYGAPQRPDDVGDTITTATVIPAGTSIVANGVIERNTDVDVFQFQTGAGAINLSVLPDAFGPNLDVLAKLYNAAGTLIATNNPDLALTATFTQTLAAGTYYISVEGTGRGSPSVDGYSKYGSMGYYQISGTVPSPGPQPPVAVLSASPVSGDVPLTVSFNGSGSTDPDSTIQSYSWNYGDGSPVEFGPVTSHTYATVGSYTATLTVVDTQSLTGTASVTISVLAPNVPPTAAFTATPSSGIAPQAVSFNGTSSSDPDGGGIISYQWNFGDNTTGTGSTISHTYSTAGNYTATLTVTDNRGGTGVTSQTINIAANVRPTAVMSATPTNGPAPLAVSFSGAGSSDPDGTISSYSWNFGDGTTGTGVAPSKTYTNVGTFTAVLTVTDNKGGTSTASKVISVTQNPATVIRVASITAAVVTVNATTRRVDDTVKITNLNNQNVSGATVTATYTGSVNKTVSGVTDANGNVKLNSGNAKKPGTVTFTVTNVTKSGNTYSASNNSPNPPTVTTSY